ncbi:unnamed protein product [Candidula unifasciata]|uniref:G-protein coupled receptors family 1 profile domain-containing protein n=1 Tax=Candidula unifasciata TaxID=100452 RepID=A0A8S3YQA2_9EUPU|nr:unnamed protein product [Candidula unifasciata]
MVNTLQREDTDSEEVSNVYIKGADIVINCCLVHLSVLVGVFGNTVTLIILSRSAVRDTTSIILMSMAACDTWFLVNLSARKCDCLMARFDPVLVDIYNAYTVSYVRRPGRWAAFVAVSHTTLISCERLLSVFFPLKVSRMVNRRTILTALLGIYLSWPVCVVPFAAFNYRIEWSFNNFYNRTMPAIHETQWFTDNRLVLDIINDLVITMVTFSFAALVAANSCATACRLSQVAKQRSMMVSKKMEGSRIDIKASRMLLVVCCVFNICNFPGFVICIYFYLDSSLRPPDRLHKLLSDVEGLLLAVNAASNFFVYTLMSARFYNAVVALIGCGREI